MGILENISNLARKGTTQESRWPEALDEAYFKIDERQIQDWLDYAVSYSGLINYYGKTNSITDGKWKAFFEQDISILLAEFIVYDNEQSISLGSSEYSDLTNTLEEMTPEEEEDIRNGTTQGEDLPLPLQNPPANYTVSEILDLAKKYNYLNQRILKVSSEIYQSSENSVFPDFKTELNHLDQTYTSQQSSTDLAFPYLAETAYLRRIASDYLEESLDDMHTHQPQVALYIAFLQLFEKAIQDLNGLKDKHFNFYFREVLRSEEYEAKADETVVEIEAGKDADAYLLSSGTTLSAGKSQEGQELEFKTTEEITLSQAKISQLHSLRIDRELNTDGSLNGLRQFQFPDQVIKDNQSISPFGTTFRQKDENKNKLGFAIASSLFQMESGDRNIQISLNLNQGFRNDFVERLGGLSADTFLQDALTGEISIEGDWLSTTYEGTFTDEDENNDACIKLSFAIGKADPPIIAWQEGISSRNYRTDQPVLRILLEGGDSYRDAWLFLHDLDVNSAEIKVEVNGITSLELQNETGFVDPSKSFLPFGTSPSKGDQLYISCPEALGKPLTFVNLDLEWKDIPDDFGNWYENYVSVEDQLSNLEIDESSSNYNYSVVTGQTSPGKDVFLCKIELLDGKEWNSLSDENLKLFGEIESDAISGLPHQRKAEFSSPGKYTKSSRAGFLRLLLEGPGEAFGHAWYEQNHPEMVNHNSTQDAYAVANASIAEANSNLDEGEEEYEYYDEQEKVEIPNKPFLPTLTAISLDYEASVNIDFAEDFSAEWEEWFQLHPFGLDNSEPAENTLQPIPQYEEEGFFYIGLENFQPPQSLSIYFRMEEDKSGEVSKLEWAGLCDDTWEKLDIIKDNTNGLTHNGIISVQLPAQLTNDNRRLPAETHWIRVSTTANADQYPKISNLFLNAVNTSFTGGNASHLMEGLAAGSITKTVKNLPEVAGISQPYTSTGGKPEEDIQAFSQRLAERLRHKGRAVSAWDYERIVLAQYPSIHKVKCILPSNEAFVPDPGKIYLVVVPRLREEDREIMRPPYAEPELLRSIQKHLGRKSSPFASISVINPLQIQLQVVCTLQFNEGTDQTIYKRKLNQALKNYIYHWMFESEDIPLGTTIENSLLVNYISNLEYVDYVISLGFRQSNPQKPIDSSEDPVENPSTPQAYSAWISADDHDLTMAEDAKGEGLNYMQIENDFIIGGVAESTLGIGFWIVGESYQVWDSETNSTLETKEYLVIKK